MNPYVMKDGATYRMWYRGFDGSHYRILYATSTDGVAWTKQGVAIDIHVPPYNFDAVAAQSVMKEGSTYKMWFGGVHFSGPFGTSGRVYYATSTDAACWTIVGVALDVGPSGSWDDMEVQYPVVTKDDHGTYWLYFGGVSSTTGSQPTYIGVATSSSGTSFTRVVPGPVLGPGPGDTWDGNGINMPFVFPGHPWRMWYSGGSRSSPSNTAIGFASSDDGTAWTKADDNPEFPVGPAGGWDGVGVFAGAVLNDSGTAQLYYTGSDGSYGRIGIAREVKPTLVADAGGPYLGPEGSLITFNASASSGPDNDTLWYRWDFESDGAWDTNWSFSPFATHEWGDDWTGTARVEVTNGTFTTNATSKVTVTNVAPIVLDVQAYVLANVTLRVAGEKWHDVRMDLMSEGNLTGSARVVRTPGSPGRQVGMIPGANLKFLGAFSIVIYYTPADDPVNGQPGGANPVWVILTFPDGSEVRLHHTFNVQRRATWIWTTDDLRPHLVGRAITLVATAHDSGSDDLTFRWDFWNGTNASDTLFNNGISPDPNPSPGGIFPFSATSTTTHIYRTGESLRLTLTVTDDDGGNSTVVRRSLSCVSGDKQRNHHWEREQHDDECSDERNGQDIGVVPRGVACGRSAGPAADSIVGHEPRSASVASGNPVFKLEGETIRISG